jgi:PhnB protein
MAGTNLEVVQRAVPMISYENVAAAVDWLSEAFGFRERGQRYAEDDGTVTHAALELGGAVVMLGWPGPDYQSPARHVEVCEHARNWLSVPYVVDGVLIYVDDVDAHCEKARSRAPHPPGPEGRAVRPSLQRCGSRGTPLDVHPGAFPLKGF